ncbi:hypothetical protein CTAM01_07853 [Colletotrichum tamarilloi]|uniref:Uncharacterized protein n=2 Tax=Colletotrichum acutatum species complex TaxID=2707335 RepID=A0ABQ9R8P8_9PEZI|nr:uncharacterized protein CTAM01_07853 [Colletotrichum tamarilloi]KAK1497583.1 hypothetical protein CTAM01_07853 [Colletotrichum tamarilloi]
MPIRVGARRCRAHTQRYLDLTQRWDSQVRNTLFRHASQAQLQVQSHLVVPPFHQIKDTGRKIHPQTCTALWEPARLGRSGGSQPANQVARQPPHPAPHTSLSHRHRPHSPPLRSPPLPTQGTDRLPSPKSQVSLLLRIPSPTYYALLPTLPQTPIPHTVGLPWCRVSQSGPLLSSLPHLNSFFAHCGTLPLNLPPRYAILSLSLQRPQNVAKPSSLPVTTFIRLRRRYLTLYSSLSLSYTHPHKLPLRKPIRDSE